MQPKYMVTSGFLGAGKTTAMIAFSQDILRRKLGVPAILADDLGSKNIVDYEFTDSTSGVITQDISGNCICYQHENLVDKLHQLMNQGANILFSDIPGCGIGALDNVYLQLQEREKDEFELMPFLCVVDPERLRMIMPEKADLNLPSEMRFLLDAQMAEADVIVVNKTDTIDREKKAEIDLFIKERYPSTPVFFMSALTGEGTEAVVDYLLSHKAPAVHREIGYGSAEFMAAEKLLCWYNRRIFMSEKDGQDIDYNEVITDIFEGIRAGLIKNGGNAPHLKMFASDKPENPGDIFKASMIGVDYPLEYACRLKNQYTALSLVINARAVADSQVMADIVEEALEQTADRYNLKIRTFFMESFGMMEEGKGNTGRASKY